MSKDKKGLRVNERIRVPQVRLVDQDNNQVGIIDKHKAMNMAREAGLDLVEVAPTSEPPVCRMSTILNPSLQKWKMGKAALTASVTKEHGWCRGVFTLLCACVATSSR